MSNSNAHHVGSLQYGVANRVDDFRTGILVLIVDLKGHRTRSELRINGKSSNDNKDYAGWLGNRPR